MPLDVCVHFRFGRTRGTAEIALEQRRVRFAVEPLLDDIDVGDLESASLDVKRAWKRTPARDDPSPNGESLDAASRRYGRALQALLAGLERAFSSSRTRSRFATC